MLHLSQVCLTSNIGNGFKVASYSEHPVSLLQEAGVGLEA